MDVHWNVEGEGGLDEGERDVSEGVTFVQYVGIRERFLFIRESTEHKQREDLSRR